MSLMGLKWLEDRRSYGQEQIIIKEAAIEVAMQKARKPCFVLFCWICITLISALHQVEEIIKGARGQAARVQIQNEAEEFMLYVMLYVSLFHCFTFWLVVWLPFLESFPSIGLLIIPIDEVIFFRGVAFKPPTSHWFTLFEHRFETVAPFLPKGND